ncbi:MAG: SDR family NAD(P)-dependent oxidoreductase [Deltaproteobacteria bacterium]|nr:SDR family NAD(P)-dependent oxidoreductase [Deltaproteobacteria bacterium]MDQ3301272.1 SDR family NAD(P)-dependent oxidoreductase [Myxococcota bacterium]
MPSAIIVGASTGIGLALAGRLVAAGWTVTGLARSAAGLEHAQYRHVVADVRAASYRDVLAAASEPLPDLCVYCTGIGHELDFAQPTRESDVFATNLVGAVITAEVIVPRMVAARAGHFIGLSSQADRIIDRDAPSYAASKAGMSSYLEGLALACRAHGVAVTNVRFGFVDTAMAKAPGPKPFMISADRAAQIIERCIRRRPIRKTYPLRMAAVLWLVRWGTRIRIWAS